MQGDFLSAHSEKGTISFALDSKFAESHYELERIVDNKCIINVAITIGRKHQIRRHFELLGFPVLGDPRYGEGNAWNVGLCLIATKLEFMCPIFKSPVSFRLETVNQRLKMFLLNACRRNVVDMPSVR